jgi:hypothetical protein
VCLLPCLLINSYLCNQLGNALFCVTSVIFAGRAQRDPAKSHELHKIAFPKVLHTRFFLILTKKKFLQTLNEVMNFSYPTSTRRHGNFAGVHTLLRIILSSNSAVLINIITGVSPPHFDFFVFYVLCQC